MRILYSSIVITLLSLGLMISSALAEDIETYEVGSSNLNVRSSPSHSAPIIGELQKGDQIRVFEENAFGWVKTYFGGEEAWVASQYLSKQSNTTATTGQEEQVTIIDNDVRVRTGPSTDYGIIKQVSKNSTYPIVNQSNDWVEVKLDDGSTGWIAMWLTDMSGETAPVSTPIVEQSKNTSSLSGYNIVIDPGHGGVDPGSIGLNNVFEKDMTMTTANVVAQKLRDAGATVIMTRDNDYFVSLENRTQISRDYNTHVFISLHYNAHSAHNVGGIETHYYTGGNSYKLAKEVQAELESSTPLRGRGIQQSAFQVIRENNAPSILVELGFITNPNELAFIQTQEYQNNVANGIVEGIRHYFAQ
ncbi:N-acetylmuramoyl-L-alanine amidase [Bacillus sp. SD088]|uniref:N-acetylmuramoyl-L-alanine amidase n=1 Tax=Bacillus sp. SD088 TaxID=2782012 RepID=UPI001A95DC5B|nr:N-acetylmuramoyl-L-alanine amidase [Bacillus sp. SD088]MBO0993701.1 N-acetylmuramoyl-L-alanine amidase [Bacillus sp. SD088]